MNRKTALAVPYYIVRAPLTLLDMTVARLLPEGSAPRRAFRRATSAIDAVAGRTVSTAAQATEPAEAAVRSITDRARPSGRAGSTLAGPRDEPSTDAGTALVKAPSKAVAKSPVKAPATPAQMPAKNVAPTGSGTVGKAGAKSPARVAEKAPSPTKAAKMPPAKATPANTTPAKTTAGKTTARKTTPTRTQPAPTTAERTTAKKAPTKQVAAKKAAAKKAARKSAPQPNTRANRSVSSIARQLAETEAIAEAREAQAEKRVDEELDRSPES